MKKKYFLLYLAIVFLFSFCNKTNNKDNNVEVDLEKDIKTLFLSEIADSISYIQLETGEELIGNITDIQFKNDQFVICDPMTNAYSIYDKNGLLITKFNHSGQGPGEYSSPGKFALGEDNTIHILDLGSKKILVYDWTGTFIRESKIEDYPRDFYISGNNYVLYMIDENIGSREGLFSFNPQSGQYKLMSTIERKTKSAGLISHYIASEKSKTGKIRHSIINNYNNEIIYTEDDSIISRLQFNITPFAIDEKNVLTTGNRSPGYSLVSYDETSNFIFLTYGSMISKTTRLCIYNKNSKKVENYNDVKNDLDQKEIGIPTRYSENKAIFILNKNENENPLLQIFHFKK